ncbi:MAG: TOBE domain-containing protein, partial [Paracoccus sp. (in: a-proteobacteria)]|nr:TOBE domain-containing protein [Paracoccus sp. (in: a-proteobacteria)]
PATRRVADFIGVMNFLPARVSDGPGGAVAEVAGLGRIELPAAQISRASVDDPGPSVGFRPESMTLLSEGQAAQDREATGIIDEVVYYGDMTYYDIRLDGAAPDARPVRIAMRNVFGRDVRDVGTRARIGWAPGGVVLFR